MKRRSFILSVSSTVLLSCGSFVSAQTGKEVSLVVPFPPGGGGDNLARAALDLFAEKYGEPIWVLNRPGAGGNIGTAAAAAAKPDGKTLAYVTNGIMCVNKKLYKNVPFDPMTDLVPVGQLSKIGLIMVLNPRTIEGVTDLPSLIKYAKEHPETVNFASSGVGTTSHLAGEYLAKRAGIKLTHIPHSGGAAALVEVMGGRIPFMIDVSSNVLPHVKSGALKALAVTTPERLSAAPEIPTMKEAGLDNYELYAWDGFALPKGVDKETVKVFSDAFHALAKDDQARRRLQNLGVEPVFSDSETFSRFIHEEQPKWDALVSQIPSARN